MTVYDITIEDITRLQKEAGVYELQKKINKDLIWLKKDRDGRRAFTSLMVGLCMLPEHEMVSPDGRVYASRNDVGDNQPGSIGLSKICWLSMVQNPENLKALKLFMMSDEEATMLN
jgi:hypothetical protein